jgi:hypothetical protein
MFAFTHYPPRAVSVVIRPLHSKPLGAGDNERYRDLSPVDSEDRGRRISPDSCHEPEAVLVELGNNARLSQGRGVFVNGCIVSPLQNQ